MTTPDLPDWGQPVGNIERLIQLVAADTNFPAPNSLGPFDTSQLGNLLIRMVVPSPGTLEYYALQMEWRNGPTPLYFSQISFHSLNGYPGTAGEFYWQLPVRGPSLSLFMNGTTADPAQITVIGSTRTLTDERISPASTAPPRLLDTGNITVTAGATNTAFHIPPVARAVRITTNMGNANINLELKGVVKTGFSAVAVRAWRDNCSSGPADVFDDIKLPALACDLTVTNNDTASHTGSIQIWDVS